MLCVMSIVTLIVVGIDLRAHNRRDKNIPWLVKEYSTMQLNNFHVENEYTKNIP